MKTGECNIKTFVGILYHVKKKNILCGERVHLFVT